MDGFVATTPRIDCISYHGVDLQMHADGKLTRVKGNTSRYVLEVGEKIANVRVNGNEFVSENRFHATGQHNSKFQCSEVKWEAATNGGVTFVVDGMYNDADAALMG
jgi:hypothetical protein